MLSFKKSLRNLDEREGGVYPKVHAGRFLVADRVGGKKKALGGGQYKIKRGSREKKMLIATF